MLRREGCHLAPFAGYATSEKSNCANLTSPYCCRRHFAKDNAMGLCQVALLRE
jgi:hypothetical protein